MDNDGKIYWHLPGFCYFFYLNQIIIKTFPGMAQAIATAIRGVRESPIARNTLPIRLYHVMTSMPPPQMRR